jgi:predicted permease
MDDFIQDLRYAARGFARMPLFTAVAVLTVAVGVGANATVFSFVNALLLRPTPGVADPSSLLSVYTSDFSSGLYGSTSYPDFETIKSDADAFREVAAFTESNVVLLRVGDTVERIRTMAVSGDFFAVTGVRIAAGRAIGPTDIGQPPAPVVVIGYRLWQRVFAGDPGVVGESISLNGTPHAVIGVAQERFDGMSLGSRFELWTPLPVNNSAAARGNRGLSVIGRLRAGITMRQAQAQLDGIAARLAAEYPKSNRGTLGQPDRPRPMTVLPHRRMHPTFRSEVAMIGSVLLAAVGLVLLIACANVAGLLLSRATARRREVAVRLALGATRGRLMRQMLTESLLLGTAGGGVGLLFALWTADALPSFFPAEQARMLDAHVDRAVLGFTALVALGSGLLVGLAPAMQGVRTGASADALRGGSSGAEGRFGARSRLGLVVGQVAVASILLIGAGLLARSLANALDADLGYGTRDAVLASIEMPPSRSAPAVLAFYDSAIESVSAVPGVESVGIARFVPVAGGSRRLFTMEGYTPRPGEDTELHYNAVSRDYFSTMQIQVIAGRSFDRSDSENGAPVAIVNELLADRFFGGSAVGRHVREFNGRNLEIVGVVRASRRLSLQDPPKPVVFYPIQQAPGRTAVIVARTAGSPSGVADAVRRSITDTDPETAVFRTVTLESHLAEALATNRLTVALVGVCGAMALLLAMVGVYGIVAYSVARRTREIGVRVALGASPGQIFRLIVSEGGRVVIAGVVVGAVAAVAGTRLLGSMLYGVSSTDPVTFILVPGLLAVVALLASCLPALRALRLNPVVALRQE